MSVNFKCEQDFHNEWNNEEKSFYAIINVEYIYTICLSVYLSIYLSIDIYIYI